MKILVNDIAATPNAGGVYSILSDLYNEAKNDRNNHWIFLLSGKFFPESNNVRIITKPELKKSKFRKLIFEILIGRKFINHLEPDVYISLQNIATLGVKAKKQIIYLHQPIPFQTQKDFSFFNRTERKLAFYQHLVGFIIKKTISKVNPNVIVQTQWMKNEVLRQTKLSENRIIVAHPLVHESKSDGKLFNNIKCADFFYPASAYQYKNHKVIYEAVNILNSKGIKNFHVKLTINSNVKNSKSNRNIIYLGHIERKKVFEMYEKNVLIFPSYIESFGLPLIEAATKGDLILAADTDFSRELLNGYDNVYYFKYDDAVHLAELMQNVMLGKIVSDGKPLDLKYEGKPLVETLHALIVNNKLHDKNIK